MMSYLDRLKGVNSEKRPPSQLQELQKDPSYSFCSTHGARFQKTDSPVRPAKDAAIASRWWLLHHPDREPAEVWTDPPATHAEILERHPEAIAAEPINRTPAALATNDDTPDDLKHMIGRTSTFYGYSPEDLATMREAARRDPEGMRRALLADPLAPFMRGRTLDDLRRATP